MLERIVHLIGHLGYGGAQKQLFCLVKALQKRGWSQSVISFNVGGIWADRLADIQIPVHVIPRNPFKPKRLWLLSRAVRKEQPRILLSWSATAAAYAQLLCCIRRPRRVFNLRADLTVDNHTGMPSRGQRLFWSALRRADYVLSNSLRSLQALREHGVTLPRNEVVSNIVFAHARAKPAEPVAVPHVVAVGALNPLKAYDVLLKAIGQLAARGILFELSLVGEGPERPKLENLAMQLGVARRVRFSGAMESVSSLLARAHILAHPSKSEGLSNTVLEAMAEGVPVVASRVGGNPEIVEDGRTGLLVKPGCAASLAAAMRRLHDDPALRGRLGVAGLQHVRKHCSEATVTLQYERVFRSLLSD